MMTRHVSKPLRDEERPGGKPNRETTDRLREYRHTTEALHEYRLLHRSQTSEAGEFFATFDERIRVVMKDIAMNGGPHPITDVEPNAVSYLDPYIGTGIDAEESQD